MNRSFIALTLCAASIVSSPLAAGDRVPPGEYHCASASPWGRAPCFAGPVELHHGRPAQEKPRPKDSTELSVAGCLKGRMFTVTGNPNESGALVDGPDVIGRSFRLAGPKDVIAEVKKHDGHLVQVTGLVLRGALQQQGVGLALDSRGRIVIGPPPVGRSSMTGDPRSGTGAMSATIDVSGVRKMDGTCSR